MEGLSAVVTGAASPRGIGWASAELLADRGWHVIVLDRNPALSQSVMQTRMNRYAGSISSVVCDVGDVGQVERFAAEVVDRFAPVGALINNAGITAADPILTTTPQAWDEMLRVNVTGAFLLSQALVPSMIERNFGRIVNVSSTAGQQGGGYFGTVAYATSKAALLGLTKSLARELGPQGVTVNAVAPGAIDTEIVAARMSDERRETIVRLTPVGRLGLAAEVAAAVGYLCSAEAAFITGATIDINGGSYMR